MNYYELINARYSCRNFDIERPVEREKLEKILEAGNLAPTSTNSQRFHFYVATGENAKVVANARILNANSFMKNCNTFIILTIGKSGKLGKLANKVVKTDYREIDLGICASHMVNMAKEIGVDSCMLGIFSEKKIKAKLDIDGRIGLILALGYPVEIKKSKKQRRDIDEIATWL